MENNLEGDQLAAVHFMDLMVRSQHATTNQQLRFQLQQQFESIQQLKTDLDQKNEEIKSLRKKLKDLELKNCELEDVLNTRNVEIKSLRSRVQKLEREKKNLEEELASIKRKVTSLESDLDGLSASKEKQDEQNQETLARLNKADANLARMKEDLADTKHENTKLRKEIKGIKELQQKGSYPLSRQIQYPHELHQLQGAEMISKEIAVLHLGELCYQIQANMYKRVLPNHYTPIRSYKVKYLLKDINKLPKDEEEKQEATQKWEELKEKLKWKDDYEDAMKSLQESRNREAHPQITEESLKSALELLEQQRALKGYISVDSIQALIKMWKLLKDN